MSAIWTTILNAFISLLGPLLSTVTPAIKQELNVLLTDLFKKAQATPNPWDDFLVGLLLDILAIPRPPPV